MVFVLSLMVFIQEINFWFVECPGIVYACANQAQNWSGWNVVTLKRWISKFEVFCCSWLCLISWCLHCPIYGCTLYFETKLCLFAMFITSFSWLCGASFWKQPWSYPKPTCQFAWGNPERDWEGANSRGDYCRRGCSKAHAGVGSKKRAHDGKTTSTAEWRGIGSFFFSGNEFLSHTSSVESTECC